MKHVGQIDISPMRTEREAPRSASSQRLLLGIGFSFLLAISVTSVALGFKTRSNEAWVNHSFEVLNKLSEVRLLIRRTQSDARAYLLSSDRSFLDEYQRAFDRIAPALLALKDDIADNAAQSQLLATSKPLVERRLALLGEMIRLHSGGESAGVAAPMDKAEGRPLMETLVGNFDLLADQERDLLTARSAAAHRTAGLLIAIELACTMLILILAMILIGESRRSSKRKEAVLCASESSNRALEIAIAERTAHLVVTNERLRHSASVLNSTFASMADAVLVVDADGAITHSNVAAQQLFHGLDDIGIDRSIARLIVHHADGLTQLGPDARPSARALRGENFDGLELVVCQPNSVNQSRVLVSGRSLLNASGTVAGAALIYRDITAIRETERKLHQSQKLDAIGRLTGGVAHDFNNMLTVIIGTTETLVAGLQAQPDLLSVASLIDRAAERCAELIGHLLAFARQQPLQPRNVDINATVLDITKLLRPTLGEQIEIEAILDRVASSVYIDRSLLANALLNLAINARDAMPDGGKLTLETSTVELDDLYSHGNPGVQPGCYVMIAVSDTGTGMSAELCEKVFEPFFTTKDAGKGSGLGLSMVHGFVRQSGGHVTIESEVGRGTTIRLYLPPAGDRAVLPAVAGVRNWRASSSHNDRQ
jgi:signal transduction histidine kinase